MKRAEFEKKYDIESTMFELLCDHNFIVKGDPNAPDDFAWAKVEDLKNIKDE